jgi:hypothetical protein
MRINKIDQSTPLVRQSGQAKSTELPSLSVVCNYNT